MIDFTKTTEWAARVEDLEKLAGIAAQIEDAKLGPFIPNFEASSEQYFDETADHLRGKARDLYFAVADTELRRKLIHARRQETQAFRDLQRAGVQDATKELASARRGIDSKPWIVAAVVATTCVVVGAIYFDGTGALAGAVGGFFIGQAVAASARREQASAIAIAESDLADAEETLRDGMLTPDWFSEAEEQSGERDPSFDDESVAYNRARAEAQ